MSEWKKVKLGDYIDVLSGYAFKSKDFSDSGIPVIKIKNVCPPYISLDDLSYVPESIAFQNQRYILHKGDVLIAMTGSHINQIASVVGRVGRVRYDDVTVLNQRVGKIVNKDDSRSSLDFIYYYLSQFEIKVELAQKAGGAANQANISPADIKELQFNCPPVEIQQRIATILSRYDTLIENYQKQIKLLEEAAQRLYKEWFVELRFPGHENTKMVDGLPEGWERKKVGEIAPIKTGKKDANFGTTDGVYPFFTCSQEPIKAPSYSFDANAVILAGNGDFNVKLYRGKFEAYQRTYVLEPDDNALLYLLYFCISENMNKLASGASGSTIKFLTKGMIDSLEVFVPSNDIVTQFNQYEESVQSKKERIQSQIRLLTESRDRLLPRLMGGEVKVKY